MYLFELIEQAQECQEKYWPMTKVFIRSEDCEEDLIETFHLILINHSEQDLVAIIE